MAATLSKARPCGAQSESNHQRSVPVRMAPKAKKTKTAVESAWEAETRELPMTRGKTGDCTDLATKTRKAINDNLKDSLTEAELYGTVVNGRTCFQQVMHDKELWLKGEFGAMGAKYWSNIRSIYQGPENLQKLVVIPEKTPIDKHVLSAIDAALKHPPQRQALLGVCRRMSAYHHGNSLALMKVLTTVCASASSKQLELGMELIESLNRVGAFAKHAELAAILRPKMDSILLQATGRRKKIFCLA
eukprot:6492184-Amphidinium_carterae.1